MGIKFADSLKKNNCGHFIKLISAGSSQKHISQYSCKFKLELANFGKLPLLSVQLNIIASLSEHANYNCYYVEEWCLFALREFIIGDSSQIKNANILVNKCLLFSLKVIIASLSESKIYKC